MALTLYAHPFSSYCQKVLIALYEKDLSFTYRVLSPEDPTAGAELARLWPIQRFPVLVKADKTLIEATVIVEFIDLIRPLPTPLLPAEPLDALEVRFLDRFFDNYVHTPMQKLVADALRPVDKRDPHGVGEARALLDKAYQWLEQRMAGREWAVGESYTLADCAASPALFYADWAHRIGEQFPNVLAYRQRLNARPAFARCIDEARPYRAFFPLGAPDRD
ncbi:glutathione S-transferase family protein [Solimonas sp. K1W22B-7]|uniref:glutathione S-transferase family protein n=1 Tax=Solimonas sp. K1W22B-7 TaxID=2303331 RepID=UPI000E32EF73|nr:glutathione S-transferase family protein [Solimonas sp. K1W22B-7]AXQ30570.1 glutathione S-transferase family protein [Solimonas sp. K1W22B-7]